jgi:hypothetical protein
MQVRVPMQDWKEGEGWIPQFCLRIATYLSMITNFNGTMKALAEVLEIFCHLAN